MAGAEPAVDGAGAGPQGKAETAKYTKNEQKENRTSTRRGGRVRGPGPAASGNAMWRLSGSAPSCPPPILGG